MVALSKFRGARALAAQRAILEGLEHALGASPDEPGGRTHIDLSGTYLYCRRTPSIGARLYNVVHLNVNPSLLAEQYPTITFWY
jgi:hypothetical protein